MMLKNKKGFTLIELLAVIVIMGILMIVAIPMVIKYIDNSKKKTFINIAGSYITATKTAWSAGTLSCQSRIGSAFDTPSSQVSGSYTYYVRINTNPNDTDGNPNLMTGDPASPWNNGYIYGYVKIVGNGNSEPKFTIAMNDKDRKYVVHAGFKTYYTASQLQKLNFPNPPEQSYYVPPASYLFCRAD